MVHCDVLALLHVFMLPGSVTVHVFYVTRLFSRLTLTICAFLKYMCATKEGAWREESVFQFASNVGLN